MSLPRGRLIAASAGALLALSGAAANAADAPRPNTEQLLGPDTAVERARLDAELGEQTPSTPKAAESAANPGNALPASETPTPTADPLSLGGQVYLRSLVTGLDHEPARSWSFRTPLLLDVYLDARLNPHARAYARTRTSTDPTQPSTSAASAAASPTVAPGAALTADTGPGPSTVIDQLWIQFDTHGLFFSVGRQHDTWGTGRVWHPTDFLHQTPRNPLDVFDARTGTTMAKLQIPLPALASNVSLYAVTENPGGTPSVASVAGAARAQVVLGTAELSLGTLLRDGSAPRYAADLSLGLGPLDVYGEAAWRSGSEVDRVTRNQNYVLADPAPSASELADGAFPRYRSRGGKLQVVGGVNYPIAYGDNDSLEVTGEYFYNQLGYSDTRPYLGLFIPRDAPLSDPATPFYLGRHYAALSLGAEGPFSWDLTSLRLTVLGNLSDRSWITRFDYALTVASHVRLEALAALHLGAAHGELRAGSSLTVLDQAGAVVSLPQFSRAPALFDLGLALRVNI
ncbi:MAG TPA: hypothetical protein VNW92_26215 [Polyangiaceae bacterium]|jgi:hypothetical protein|nr:hypothetical protein [Polyangiaceae bacterium]